MRLDRPASTFLSIALVALAGSVSACAKSAADDATTTAAARAEALAAMSRDVAPATAATGASTASASAPRGDTVVLGATRTAPPAATTGIPDQDFARAMIDHHAVLIALAHGATERADVSPAARDEARGIERTARAELDTMETLSEKTLREHHSPTVTAEQRAANERALAAAGPEFDRRFREALIAQHTAGVAIMDRYLPSLVGAPMKALVQRMKTDRGRDIAELQRELGR